MPAERPALTTGGWFRPRLHRDCDACRSQLESRVSLALRRRLYVPASGKVAWVTGVAGELNTTVAGPLTWLHVTFKRPVGRPSSVTLPFRVATFTGNVMIWARSDTSTTVFVVHCPGFPSVFWVDRPPAIRLALRLPLQSGNIWQSRNYRCGGLKVLPCFPRAG